jgi:hypothetical protein
VRNVSRLISVQLKELAESVASFKGGRQRRHPDYDDDSDTDADSVDSVED